MSATIYTRALGGRHHRKLIDRVLRYARAEGLEFHEVLRRAVRAFLDRTEPDKHMSREGGPGLSHHD